VLTRAATVKAATVTDRKSNTNRHDLRRRGWRPNPGVEMAVRTGDILIVTLLCTLECEAGSVLRLIWVNDEAPTSAILAELIREDVSCSTDRERCCKTRQEWRAAFSVQHLSL
jgi:hypothetical protein